MSYFRILLAFFASEIFSCYATCPSWAFYDDKEDRCRCGQNLEQAVICDEQSLNVYVKKCFCMTYSAKFQEVVLSSCRYNCHLKLDDDLFYSVPRNVGSINNEVCGVYNREGQGCSRCKKGYGIAVYSYDFYCVECTHYRHNWLLYVAIAYLPLTLLYIIILIGRITVTNSVLSGYVFMGQLISTPLVAQLMGMRRLQFGNNKYSLGTKLLFLLYGIWNLDFARSLYTPFCLHPDLSEFQAVALDFCLAVYPLLLVILTYFLVQIHDRYSIVSKLLKPVHFLLRLFNKEMDINASLIDVFVTFIVLSNVKFVHVAFSLISTSITFVNVVNDAIPKKYLYLNESMEFMGKEHKPYFIIGIFVIAIFSFLPMILSCLYPCLCFKKILSYFRLNSLSLHFFMEAFQGQYKSRPRDYRWFSSLPFLILVLNYLSFYLSVGLFYFTLLGFILAIYSFVVLCLRPYRQFSTNVYYSMFIMNLSFLSFYSNKQANMPIFNLPFQSFFYYILIRCDVFMSIFPTAVILIIAILKVVKWVYSKFTCSKGQEVSDENDYLLGGNRSIQ